VPRNRTSVGRAARLVRRLATSLVDAVQARRASALGRRARAVRLDDVRRRLELLVTAVYDRPIPIAAAETPKRRSWSFGNGVFGPRHLRRAEALPTTDGERIQLPREIEGVDADTALAEYRLMAIEQAERIARNTTALIPALTTPLERDLYLLREGASVDASIARAVPGLRAALVAARARALAARPSMSSLTSAERVVERLVRASLADDLTQAAAASPNDSLAWARRTMRELAVGSGKYRGIAPVAPWGAVKAPLAKRDEPRRPADDLATMRGSKYGVGKFGHGTGAGGKQSSEPGVEEGTTDAERDTKRVLDGNGRRRVEGAGESNTTRTDLTVGIDFDSVDDSTTTEPTTDDATRDAQHRERRQPNRSRRVPAPQPAGTGTEYPEWDWEAGDYRAAGAIVRPYEPDLTDDTWGNTVLARHGALVRRLRERFERLRARRTRLNQQRDGDELDLTACVRAWVDQRTGHTVDDRLYIAVRSARRGLAIALLIDISGSTDEWIDARRRVIDVEKIALLLASEALDALGDLYAVLTFSGKGRANVRMRTIKAFDESNGRLVRQRISALQPEGYTRAGAAIRHATALLERQPAAHRLLLIISDGKPNDVDGYEGLSGIEDTRQAIIEARSQGVYPFCLTIDRQGQEYLGRIFGEAGHTVLRNPQQLPMALIKVVKHLLAS